MGWKNSKHELELRSSILCVEVAAVTPAASPAPCCEFEAGDLVGQLPTELDYSKSIIRLESLVPVKTGVPTSRNRLNSLCKMYRNTVGNRWNVCGKCLAYGWKLGTPNPGVPSLSPRTWFPNDANFNLQLPTRNSTQFQ